MLPESQKSQQARSDGTQSPMTIGRRDVEKRWADPSAYRRAALYSLGVIAAALIVGVVFASTGGANLGLAVAVPAIFLAGGLGALGLGIASYFRGRQWVGWEGAGWFLLVLMLVSLVLPYSAR